MEKKKLTIKEIGLPRLLLMLGAGIVLLMLSFPDSRSGENTAGDGTDSAPAVSGGENGAAWPDDESATDAAGALEQRLEELLKKVSGIGDVQVMITLKSSAETVVLKDSPYTSEITDESDSEGGHRTVTQIEQGEETILAGDNEPYVIKRIEPEVQGVVVIAEGAGDLRIVTEIVEAVEVLFEVPAHKVKVMKMGN